MSTRKSRAVPTARPIEPIARTEPWRQWIPVALILAAAIILRVIYLLQYKAYDPFYQFPIVDSEVYDSWARRIAAGEGYGASPYYTAPLYPYLLALIYRVFGHKLLFVSAGQPVLGVLNIFLVYILARRISGHRAGLVAMVLLMLYAPLAFLETKLLTETLSVTLGLAAILLLMRVLDRPSPLRFIAVGVVLGIGAVCRANALITIVLIAAWLPIAGRGRERFRRTLAVQVAPLLAGVMLAVLPVTVRNYVVGKDLALLTTNGGIVFAQANNKDANGISLPLPGFTGSLQSQQEEEMARASQALGRKVRPSESSSYWFGEGVRYIEHDPAGFLRLAGRKLVWSLHNGESACIYNVYMEKDLVPALRLMFLPASVLIAFGLYGIVRTTWKTRNRNAQLLALSVLSVFLSLVVFSVSSRYRAPAAPALAVFAGSGICGVIELLRARNLRGLALPAACIVPVFMVSLVPYPRPYVTVDGPTNLGAVYFLLGRNDEALVQLRKALEMQPDYASANFYMGRALAENGDYEKAVKHYKRVFDMQPDNSDAHYYLAFALTQLGKPDEAVREYQESIRITPNFPDAHFNLAVLLGNFGRRDDAIREYRRAVELRPGYIDARNNLIIDLYLAGRYAEAWDEVRQLREHGGDPSPGLIKALSERMPEPE